MQGYYKKPEETHRPWMGTGGCTGDMATMRPDGTIRFFGRYKDMLKVGGENVDPMEVEALLLQHPAVSRRKSSACPTPACKRSHVPAVLLPDAQMDASDLIAFCRGKVASFKVPRHVLVMHEYPMTASGRYER